MAGTRRSLRLAIAAVALALPLAAMGASPASAASDPAPTFVEVVPPGGTAMTALPPATSATAAVTTAPAGMTFAQALEWKYITDPAFRVTFRQYLNDRIASDPAFKAQLITLIQQKVASDPTFAAVFRAALIASGGGAVNVGASTWTGGALTNPGTGAAFPAAVLRWANAALAVMAELDIDSYYLPGVLAQIQQESGGQPNAANSTDSNARAGYASMGLLQIIAPTYRAYAKSGYQGTLTYVTIGGRSQQFQSPYQTVPGTNLYAALTYVKRAYGYSKFMSWRNGSNGAY